MKSAANGSMVVRAGEKREATKARRLVARDIAMLQVIAEARCLSAEQMQRLFFAGRTDRAMRKGLFRLLSLERPYLKRMTWFDRSGQRSAYSLAQAGYEEIEGLGERAPGTAGDDVGVEYIKHHLLLTDLFVGLIAAPMEAAVARQPEGQRTKAQRRGYARPAHPGFRWHVVGDVELPWRQLEKNEMKARILRPDAILELPQAKRRIFVEAETGSHSITTTNAQRIGATVNKVRRYYEYCSLPDFSGSGRTWYQTRYQDGYRPEVLFLVPNDERARSVQAAIDEWRRTHHSSGCAFRVATAKQELLQLVPLVWPGASAHSPAAPAAPVPPASGVLLSPTDLGTFHRFFVATVTAYKTRRQAYRSAGHEPPPYPDGLEECRVLLRRLIPKTAI